MPCLWQSIASPTGLCLVGLWLLLQCARGWINCLFLATSTGLRNRQWAQDVLPPDELAALLASPHRPNYCLGVRAGISRVNLRIPELVCMVASTARTRHGSTLSMVGPEMPVLRPLRPTGTSARCGNHILGIRLFFGMRARRLMFSRADCRSLRTFCKPILAVILTLFLMAVQMLSGAVRASTVHPMARTRMDENFTFYEDALGACERILKTPIPLTYTR